MIAAVAIEPQVVALPDGLEIIIDNQALCFACQTLASGGRLRTSTAHYPTYRRLERANTNIGRPGFFNFRWVPSCIKDGDGHEEMVPADDSRRNEEADDLATRGQVPHRPPQSIVEGAPLRVQLIEALRVVLVTMHIIG